MAIVPFSPSTSDAEFLANLIVSQEINLPIYHYISVRHFLSLLKESSLYLKRLDQYHDDDPHEGLFPSANANISDSITRQIHAALPTKVDKAAMMESQHGHVLSSYIHCWFHDSTEKLHMWKSYGDDCRGVCIKSSSHSLLQSLPASSEQLHLTLARCTYRDDHEPIPEIISTTPSFRKRRKYADEQEIRLLAQLGINSTERAAPPLFQLVPINVSHLMHSVILGPKMLDENRAAFRLKMLEYFPPEIIIDSELQIRI